MGGYKGEACVPWALRASRWTGWQAHTTIRQCYWLVDHAARAERIFRILRNKNNTYLPTLSKVFYDGKRNQQRVIHAVDCFLFWRDLSDDLFAKLTSTAHLGALRVRICHRISFVSSCLLKQEKNMNILKNILPFMFFCDPIFSYSLMKRGKNGLK